MFIYKDIYVISYLSGDFASFHGVGTSFPTPPPLAKQRHPPSPWEPNLSSSPSPLRVISAGTRFNEYICHPYYHLIISISLCFVGGQEWNKENSPLSATVFCPIVGRKYFDTVHVGPICSSALFILSFPTFFFNQTKEIITFSSYFFPLPSLPSKITPTTYNLNPTIKKGLGTRN